MARPRTPTTAIQAYFDEFQLDEANASLQRGGKPVALAPTPFSLLCAFARRPAMLLTKEALLDEVWGHQFVTESVLKTAISDLRNALGDDARQPRFIETVPRRGYRFVGAIHALAAQAGAAPLPGAAPAAASAATAGSGFIGRSDALGRLAAAWARVCAGERAIVWVAGEPGIGKSTLIERFVREASGGVAARGQCVDLYGAGEAYLPVLEAIGELCRSDREAVALLRSVAPTWLLQLPWLSSPAERETLRRELAGAGPERMLREMGEWLDRYTVQRPLLLVTEDLHWGDRATVQLVDYLARRRSGARLMWLASFRLAEVVALDHPLRPLRHELRLHGRCEEIVLDAFSEREVADYLLECAPALATDEEFVRALHQRTDGVPLFVASIVTETLARPPATPAAGLQAAPHASLPLEDGTIPLAVPENLTGLIDHYIARLERVDRDLLTVAAACGTEFRTGTVARALDTDAARIEERCDALARQQLWLAAPATATASPTYAFRHTLFRQVLYERTPAGTRVRTHRQVGHALEVERAAGTPVRAAELALHFARCREPLLALRYYAEAAHSALMLLSPTECMALAGQGLALLGEATEGAERRALEFELAMLHSLAGFHVLGAGDETQQTAARAYALIGELPHHPLCGLLLHHHGFIHCLRGEYAQSTQVADRAAAGDGIMRIAAATLHAQLGLLLGRPRHALEWIEQALPEVAAAGRAAGLAFMHVTLLSMRTLHLVHLGRIAAARASFEQAYARADEFGYPTSRLVVLWTHALMAVRLDDQALVEALAERLQALVEESDLGQGRGAWRWFRGWALARRGAAREGVALIRAGYEENTRLGMVAGASETLGYVVEAQLLAGDTDGAQRDLGEALRIATTNGERVYLPQLLLLQGRIAAARGDAAVARAALRTALDEARAQQAPWHELHPLIQLIDSGAGSAGDRTALRACVAALDGADDTALVAQARQLLQSDPSGA